MASKDIKSAKEYYQEEYAGFWKRQVKVYGTSEYVKNIIILLNHCHAKTAFEVGIGTGWPFAAELYEKGVKVSGCDIASRLIADAKKNYPDMKLYAGELKDTEEQYDLVYCVRVSWYISDFQETIYKMLSMCNQGGYVIFDVRNKKSLFGIYSVITTRIKEVFSHRKEYGTCLYSMQDIKNALHDYQNKTGEDVKYKVYFENKCRKPTKEKWKKNKIIYVIKKL